MGAYTITTDNGYIDNKIECETAKEMTYQFKNIQNKHSKNIIVYDHKRKEIIYMCAADVSKPRIDLINNSKRDLRTKTGQVKGLN